MKEKKRWEAGHVRQFVWERYAQIDFSWSNCVNKIKSWSTLPQKKNIHLSSLKPLLKDFYFIFNRKKAEENRY